MTAQGKGQQALYVDAIDRQRFLNLLCREIGQQYWWCYAYCLMDNHYHLLLKTLEGKLINGWMSITHKDLTAIINVKVDYVWIKYRIFF